MKRFTPHQFQWITLESHSEEDEVALRLSHFRFRKTFTRIGAGFRSFIGAYRLSVWRNCLVVLITIAFLFNPSPVAAYYTNMPASVVVGQGDFTSNSTGVSASKFTAPRSVLVDPKGRLIVAEASVHRVLIWNSIPTRNGVSADLVLGQADFISGSANRGGSVAANTLNNPTSFWSDGEKLFISDESNHRVLLWRSFPTINGQAADVVIGQADFSSTVESCDASHPRQPGGVIVYNGKLLISSRATGGGSGGNRVLIWNSIPETNGVSANVVIGQPNLTTCTLSAASSSTLNVPRLMSVSDDGKLFLRACSKSSPYDILVGYEKNLPKRYYSLTV